MTDRVVDLFGDFPRRYHDDWERLAEPTLKGKKLDTLVDRSLDDVEVEPLYTRQSWPSDKDPSGLPGFFPYTRGSSASGSVIGGWGIGQRYADPRVARATEAIRLDRAAGVNHVVVAAPIATVQDASSILDAVEDASFTLDVDDTFETAAVFVAASEAREKPLIGNLGLDPLRALLTNGHLDVDIDGAFRLVTDLAHHVRGNEDLKAVLVRGDAYDDGGASETQELAYAIATGLTYLRVLLAGGFSVREANAQIGFSFSAGPDVFRTIAKLRAARRMWSRITGACGARDAARRTSIDVTTSRHALSTLDVWVNVLRGTTAAFGAVAGGADRVVVRAHVEPLGLPDDAARRVAKNIQIVLRDEVGLGRVIDPAGGAWAIEKLTDQMARSAWTKLQEVEGQGGIERTIESGFIAQRVDETRARRAAALSTGADTLTGVNDFPWLAEPNWPVEPAPDVPRTSTVDVDLPLDSERGRSAVAAIACLSAGGTRGDLTAALRRHDLRAKTRGLSVRRRGDGFERLRRASHTAKPRVLLVSFGTPAAFSARATYARNFFATAGIDADDHGGFDAPDQAAAAAEGHRIAVLCSSDEVYESNAVEYARALRRAGVKLIYLAGRAGQNAERERRAGVDVYIHRGVDALTILEGALSTLEVTP